MLPIAEYIEHFMDIWESSPGHLPEFKKYYNRDEQITHEKNFELFQQKIKQIRSPKQIHQFRNDPGKSFFPKFKSFLELVFDFDKEQLDIILSDEFKDVSKDFFYKAREFGPELKPENIYQGIRNVWIMNGIQLMLNVPVRITPSVFAYSMIYPYSDNLLDDPAISGKEKKEFSERFKHRLYGNSVSPKGFIEEQLFRLVAMFEEEFPRKKFPEVYESLYAIQKGQTDSLSLITSNGISERSIQEICFEKGGASVLADGYLVAGMLNKEQERALFGYGVYLQLLDDIQDVKEDREAETKTIFTTRTKDHMGEFVNKTIHFGRAALEEMKCFPNSSDGKFLNLMNKSIETMIIESVGLNPTWYSDGYLKEIERFSPLGFAYVREKRSESKSQRFAVFNRYFEQAKKGVSI